MSTGRRSLTGNIFHFYNLTSVYLQNDYCLGVNLYLITRRHFVCLGLRTRNVYFMVWVRYKAVMLLLDVTYDICINLDTFTEVDASTIIMHHALYL